MYTPGKLLFFDPFYFNDGSPAAPKFFLVLKVTENNVILASLPSSRNHLPSNHKNDHGCLEVPDICITCYIFIAGTPITNDGWSFELDTYLYGWWLDDYNLDVLNSNYSIKGVDYDIIGELTDAELQNVIKCFVSSSTVKRKYKKSLSS